MLSLVDLSFMMIFLMSLFKIMSSNKMIMVLMSIEVMMMSVFFIFYNVQKAWFLNPIVIVIFLSFMVCDSVLGLGVYIYITRMCGNDSFKSMNLLK